MAIRGLYILFEGLPATVIDAQVMLHVREMRAQGIVDFEVWSFAHSASLYTSSSARLGDVQRLSQGKVRLFRSIKPALPVSGLLNACLLWWHIHKHQPSFEFVHARTDYSAAVCGYLRLVKRFDLVWDCRGDVEAEIRGKYTRPSLLQRLVLGYQVLLARWRVYWAALTCQKAIFVTQVLKSLQGKHLGDKPFQIIPSIVADEVFFFDETLRAQARQQLGYSQQDKIIVYSGSLTHYQCFPESVDLFARLHQEDGNFKLLVLTPQVEEARKTLSGLPERSFQVFAARYEEVNAYLNAADYALLLREYHPINTSASPTKFAEYCLAGLPVIMRDSVPESFAVAKEIGNLCVYDGQTVAFPETVNRAEVSAHYQSRLTRKAILPRYRALYEK